MAYEGPHPFPETSGGTGVTFSTPVVQLSTVTNTTYTSTTATIPFDDTRPQIGEGAQILSLSFTPKSTTNILYITFNLMIAITATRVLTVALFDGNTSAIYANATRDEDPADTELSPFFGEYRMVAGTTSAIPFTVRFGPSAGTGAVNGNSTVRLFGGTCIAYLQVMEIVP